MKRTPLQDADAATPESFEWLSQLRFDFDPTAKDATKGLTVRMADAQFEYGFEYLGIGERLVQTPLTDRWDGRKMKKKKKVNKNRAQSIHHRRDPLDCCCLCQFVFSLRLGGACVSFGRHSTVVLICMSIFFSKNATRAGLYRKDDATTNRLFVQLTPSPPSPPPPHTLTYTYILL